MQGVDITKPKQFTREFTDKDGVKRVWYYDTERFGFNPWKVEMEYPEGYEGEEEVAMEDNENLPKTKKKYMNPANGKMVGYTRARMLGLIS
jgi:hypothetical protein